MFLKVTLHAPPPPQKHVYQVFQWMIYLVEGQGQMNLPGKNSVKKMLSKEHLFQEGVLE